MGSAIPAETAETLVAQGISVLTVLHYFALFFTLLCTRCAREVLPTVLTMADRVLEEGCLGAEPQRFAAT